MHIWLEIVTRYFRVFCLTQTLTQKPRGQESAGEERMASSVSLSLSDCFFVGYMAWVMTPPMAFRIFSWVRIGIELDSSLRIYWKIHHMISYR